jgi:uncharacterized membrane protein
LTIPNESSDDDYPYVNFWGYICGIQILSVLAPPPTPSTSATSHFYSAWPWSHEAEAWWELLTIPNESSDDDYPYVIFWGYICGIQILSVLAPPPTPSTSATSHFYSDWPWSHEAEAWWELLTIPNESSDDDYP